jgi:hypothetical protein
MTLTPLGAWSRLVALALTSIAASALGAEPANAGPAALRPPPTRYVETPDTGAPLAPGAQRVKRARLGLVVPGAVLFGTVWAASWGLTGYSLIAPFTRPPPASGAPTGIPLAELPVFAAATAATSIPVAGPLFLGLVADTPPWKSYARAPAAVFFVAAAMQATGLALLVSASLWPEFVVRAPQAPSPAPVALDWSLTPGAGDAPAGVTLILRLP